MVFKEDAPASTAPTASPQMVTKSEMDEIIEGWKTKFHHLSEGVCAIQLATEKFHTHMDSLQRDSCTRVGAQERRIIQMQEGLARSFSREMRPQAPLSSAPLRFAVRAHDEHAHDAVGSTVKTPSRLPLRVSRQPVRGNRAHAWQRRSQPQPASHARGQRRRPTLTEPEHQQ